MPTWSNDLINLAENQYGFDPDALGFPSISACRAIVYHTDRGLFGFHQASGAHPDRFDRFANKFARFVNSLDVGRGLNLYCAAKVAGGGSYGQAREHLDEMKAFADALNFRGPIKSYDLSYKWATTGVFVEVRNLGDRCEMYGNPWVEYHDDRHKAAVDLARIDYHKLSYPPRDEFVTPNRVFVAVDVTAQEKIEPMRIG